MFTPAIRNLMKPIRKFRYADCICSARSRERRRHPEISEEAHLPSQVDGEDLQGITAGLQDWLSFGNIHWTALS
ncbi:hypothetical protein PSHT_05306 [Puccinia striiformis]|uniref:Uncharacterized protein n=1 Tax=Puccinia striiformis TaxID=27350 RepID=A0A2S4WAP5_9BASI|nr:hypothetical protein PSHT_05306 [Puccinia striiformis]